MAKIKNVFGEDRIVGERFVLAGAVLEVPEDEVFSYTQQDGWEPADDEARAAHDAALEELAELVEAEKAQEQGPVEPPGNGNREQWAAYVLAAGLATEDEIAGMGRDQLRDTYKTTEA